MLWFIEIANSALKTLYTRLHFGDIHLKTDATDTLHLRNSDDTDDATFDAGAYEKAGAAVDWWDGVDLWGWEVESSSGSALAINATASQIFCGYGGQGAGAVNDTRNWKIYLNPGTYHFESLHVTQNASAIITYNLYDSNAVLHSGPLLIDQYTAGSTFNVRNNPGNFTVTQGDYYTLTGVAATKNASSAGFAWLMTKLNLRKTA